MSSIKSNMSKRLAQCAAVVILSVLGVLGTTTAFAASTPAVTAKGSVNAGQLSVSVTGFNNVTVRNSDFAVAMPFTVTNTTESASKQKATMAVKLSSSSSVFGTSWVWPVANTTACPVNASVGSGSKLFIWPNGPSLATSLAPGESQTYCLRTMREAGLGNASGSVSMRITAAATLSLGNFQASDQASASMTTKAIYPEVAPSNYWYTLVPQNQNWCFDVAGGVNAVAGALVGTYNCHNSTDVAYGNQWFSFKPASDGFAIRPKGPSGTSLQPNGSSIVVRANNTTLKDQMWLIQQSSTTTYQIVNLSSGLCITAPASTGNLSLAVCNDLATQKFVYTRVNVPVPTMADLSESVSENASQSESQASTENSTETQEPEDSYLNQLQPETADTISASPEGRDPSEAATENQGA